jgi:hypothetical protein
MNQLPDRTSVKSDFANHVWKVREGVSVRFSTEGNNYLMTVDRAGAARTRYQVTRTVGSRFNQFYIGVQTEGPEPAGQPTSTTEHKLPFGYWFRMKRWLPVNYFDVEALERYHNGSPAVLGVDVPVDFLPYTQNCLWCHNTYPEAYRLQKPDVLGFPDMAIDADLNALKAALPRESTKERSSSPSSVVPPDPDRDLVTLGISCESCHMGGREHALAEKQLYFFPANRHVRLNLIDPSKTFAGERKDPITIQGVCAQCHSAEVPTFPNGAGMRNSRESADMRCGSCATQIRCVNCHEPHTAGEPSGGPPSLRHLEACTRCHSQYAGLEQAAAHARHSHETGVTCLDCHMPRYNQGINEVVRTHRISAPVEEAMVSSGSPNACNICHLDKSTRWAIEELKAGWGRRLPFPSGTVTASVHLEQPAGKLWLSSPHPATRLIATQAHARSPLGKANLTEVMDALNDPTPSNRSFALFAVERILGRSLSTRDIDIVAPAAERQRQIEVLKSGVKGIR